jgi:hypothetical protein
MEKIFEINGDETFKATINDFKSDEYWCGVFNESDYEKLEGLSVGDSVTIISMVNNIPVPIKRIEDKPKFVVVDSAPKRFTNNRG